MGGIGDDAGKPDAAPDPGQCPEPYSAADAPDVPDPGPAGPRSSEQQQQQQHERQQVQQQTHGRPPATPEHGSIPSSNALDIDQVHIAPAGRPPPSSSQLTSYQQITADEAAAAGAAAAQQQQQQQAATNELAIDDISWHDLKQPLPTPLPKLLGRPIGSGMSDFPSGGLDLVQHLNLDGIFLEQKASVTHGFGAPTLAPQQQQQQQQRQSAPLPVPDQHQQQQQQHDDEDAAVGPSSSSSSHPSSASTSRGRHKKQQQQQGSQPRPHPFYVKPQHVKSHFKVTTADGWKLHLIRTQVLNAPPTHHHPVILCPGLGSSGAYSFDLSPAVSLADYLAGRGWDVWTCELRGNGMSDKPALFSNRSCWWTIDDYVEKDVPAVIRFVLKQTHTTQVHFLGHSMGGMILCGVMARVDTTTARIRSCIAAGSGLFLEDSWWRLFDRFRFMLNALWVVPSGSLLRAYSRFMFGPWRIPYIDMLYFWPSNVDPRVGRAMMRRNFSNISVGVIKQISSAFGPKGLTSADGRMVYADATRLSKIAAPSLFLVGDRDRMCPPEGCRKTWQMFGSQDKRFVCLGPRSGFADHYGHFDILIGRRVETEVFPLLHQFLLQHDQPKPRL